MYKIVYKEDPRESELVPLMCIIVLNVTSEKEPTTVIKL